MGELIFLELPPTPLGFALGALPPEGEGFGRPQFRPAQPNAIRKMSTERVTWARSSASVSGPSTPQSRRM